MITPRLGMHLALNKWRALSAFLLHPSRSQRTALEPSSEVILQQSSVLVAALNEFLAPFTGPETHAAQQQLKHLQAVVNEFAKFGYKLFSQPTEWHLLPGASQTRESTAASQAALSAGKTPLVVCPGLVRLPDPNGDHSSTGLRLVASPTVAAV
jgi:hypothetical protein